jgi:predicted dehydrogenase
MLKAGVIGAGHLGKIHLKLLQASKKYELIGFFENDRATAQSVEKEFGYQKFESYETLLDQIDVIDIVTPTMNHFDCAKMAIERGKHVFIEKPITNTLEEAQILMALAEKNDVQGQVGHVERFNPAFTAVQHMLSSPMFIETHRLAEFNPRGTDVPVVLDLMIHDIDIILKVVGSKVVDISASGVSVISASPDIANARLVFENGCVANLTASRISLKNMRKSRFFQKDAYISVDFLEKSSEVVQMETLNGEAGDFDMILENAEGIKKRILFERPEVASNNAILDELNSFADAINNNATPVVSLSDGTEALRVAHEIIKCFKTELLKK